jgi:sortase A
MNKPKILLSWILMAGGSYFVFTGAWEYVSARVSQEQAADSWRAGTTAPSRGEVLARLSIPRLHTELYVFEGTDHGDLRRGPGHLEGSAAPGAGGNCVIAGHRDTHFRALRDIRKGDTIEVATGQGEFVYRVSSISVVAPENTDALQPAGEAMLTLITCYPFRYIGAAPKRFIVRADLVASHSPQTASAT